MNRRHFIFHAGISLAGISLLQKDFLSAFVQQGWKITMLTDNIGIFTERGGTIAFLLSDDGILVVDAQFPDQSKHLIDELKKKSEKPFRLLINTHHHGDHTSGNISFKGLVDHVLAHENSKVNQANAAKQNNSEDRQLYPDRTYKETWCEQMGKEKICLSYHGAAHTNGDSIVFFERSNIVHMGDLVFNRRHPVVDRKAGASMENWITVLAEAEKKFDNKTKFVFGHTGEGYEATGTKKDLAAFREYLVNVLIYTKDAIKAGKTKEEILQATGIPGSPEWKGGGLQNTLSAAYDELTA